MAKPLRTLFLLVFSLQSIFSQKTINQEEYSIKIKQAENYLSLLQKQYAEGEYQLHKDYSDSLLQVAKNYDLSKMHVLALVNQAVYFNNRNERLKAIELYHEALEQCKLIPDDFRAKTVVLVNMGNTYNSIGFYDKAIATMEKVLIVADSTENSENIKAAALLGLSNNFAELEDFEKTLAYAEEAKKIGEKSQNEAILASALNNMIDAYVNIKDYNKALSIGETALKLTSLEKPTRKRGWLLLNIGVANYHLGNFDTSFKYLTDCLTLAQEKGLSEIEMYGHEYLAKVHEQKNNYKASNDSQKKYSALRDEFLNDNRDASNADLKKDITLKEETIIESNEELLTISKKRKQLDIWATALLIGLIGLLFFYIKRKKSMEVEQSKLRAQYLNLQQTISNNQNGIKQELSKATANEESSLKPYKNSSLTPLNIEEYKKQTLAFMDEEKPFLNPDLSQSEFASKIGISSHHFSEVLHFGFEQNFYNFINSYRVNEAQKLMKDEKYLDAKIIAIAFDSGFNSKTSFNRVFKKLTGQTPSEYRADI